ncbi:pickpocket protein 19-like isoform X1 [Ceratina calcarata]|uniref:Pickpocket protein 19-like isoform X1 n=1 Tax=Ceratina calcarata TaxID=156304 RepID=A0AAJ7NF40_9HYME|nr:pickpocket protein 19-like isoform X1 [Ceratina calcarata]
MASEGGYFYKDEILPDFQTRQKAALAGKESIPNDLPNKIGMPTINPKSNVKKYLVECVSLSSLHGFNHLVAPNRHPVERFMSFLVIAGCLSCLILLSSLFWERYQNEAITIAVSLDLDEFKLLKLSLFICPVDNIVRSKIPEVFKKYGIEHTSETEQLFTFLSNISYDNVHETPYYYKFPAKNWTDVLYDLKKEISPNVLNVNDPHETWVWTERGLCFATRSMTANFYSMENWRKQNMPLQDDPFNIPQYPSDSKILEKFRVEHTSMISLLDPLEYPIFDTPRKLVESKMLHSAIVHTYRVGMHLSHRRISVKQRGCKMLVDGGLSAVPFYSENACYEECRMREILKICHCRPHFAKPIDGQMTCGSAQLRCIGRIKHKLFLYGFAPESCDCLEKCNKNIYDLKPTASTALDDAPISSSVMTLEIKLPTVIYSRELSYDLSSFLSSIGGAAGLFMGASVLSFVELFYFVTLRLYFRTKEYMAKRMEKLSLFKYLRGRK